MRIFAMYPPGAAEPPARWARSREAEGWDGVAVSDHVWTDGATSPHLWVALGAMAGATTRVALTSSFANALLRHPVDFAQASLMLQAVSSNRFEAGLGAGWDRREAAALGIEFPEAPVRLARYAEALQVAGQLFHDGRCRFAGQHFGVDVDSLRIAETAPPALVASAGSRRTIELVAPLVDCLEVKLPGFASPSRSVDFRRLRSLGPPDIEAAVARVRAVAPDVALGVTIVVAAGTDRRVLGMANTLEGSWYGGFVGAADQVAANVLALADLGIDRLQLGGGVEGTYAALAAPLFGAGEELATLASADGANG